RASFTPSETSRPEAAVAVPSAGRSLTGFTLIELLIVVGIVVVLSVVILLALNPVQLLRQARDGVRLSDLQAINRALLLYQTDQSSGSFGAASTTYVSLPDPAATTTAGTNCAGMGLPTLPSGWNYHCAASSTLRNADNTGWIPVAFTQISYGAPLSALPIDPVNTTSSGNYYTYTPGGSWHLAASLESDRYRLGGVKDKAGKDGGSYTGLYEVGTNLALLPVDYGDISLVGYWKFDEGSGTSVNDASGRGNNGTLTGSPGWIAGKSNYALDFSSASQYAWKDWVDFTVSQLTISFWMKADTVSTGYRDLVGISAGDPTRFHLNTTDNSIIWYSVYGGSSIYSGVIPQVGVWYHVVGTHDGQTANVYVDGILKSSSTSSGTSFTSTGLRVGADTEVFDGQIDDVRIYNRALSAAEISALYNATK
ncbi:MAG: LamG domain-containing protein, partial [Patescibacteria group bacterium]